MKSYMPLFALLAALIAAGCGSSHEAATQTRPANVEPFYDQMTPYGSWFEYRSYGYVWHPNVEREFAPYATSGRWVFTDAGWTWESDYPWGWAAFHYGRWDYDDVYGWFWVPDQEWGPAWVAWRRAPGYYGWAPLRPNMGYRDALGADYYDRNERWLFVHDVDLARHDLGRCYVDRSRNGEFVGASRIIGNTRHDERRNVTYIAGPELPEVQRVSPTRIEPVVLEEVDRPDRRPAEGRYPVYRPTLPTGARRISPAPIIPPPNRMPDVRDQRPAPVRPPDTTQPVPLPTGKRSDAEDRTLPAPVVKPVTPAQPQPRVVRPAAPTQPPPANVHREKPPEKAKAVKKEPEKKKPVERKAGEPREKDRR